MPGLYGIIYIFLTFSMKATFKFSCLFASFLLLFPWICFAQVEEEAQEESLTEEVVTGAEVVEEEEKKLQAVIQSENIVEVGKTIIFDASKTTPAFEEQELSYEWHFGDGNRQQGIDVVHSYRDPGDYQVTLVVRDPDGNSDTITTDIFVYKKLVLLVTDNMGQSLTISRLVERARKDHSIYIKLIESYDSVSEFLAEEDLTKKLTESLEDFKKTTLVVVWTKGSVGLTVLSHFKQVVTDQKVDFSDKGVVFIYDGSLSTVSNIAKGTFRTIKPQKIVLTRQEAVWPLMESGTIDSFISVLEERGIDFKVVDKSLGIGPFNFMSFLVNFMIDRGIPSNSIKLILMLPIIATVVAFMKQIVGVTTLGVYTPSILALSFIALDIKYGLFILLIILLIGTLFRLFLKKYRLLYIPRVAIILTTVSLTILGILLLGAYFDITQLVSISIFPMLIMSTLVEKFVSIQTDRGLKPALLLITETLLVAILCYYIAEWGYLKTLMLGHPELIFVFLVINIGLGRWTGLRIFEYVRFREVISKSEEE